MGPTGAPDECATEHYFGGATLGVERADGACAASGNLAAVPSLLQPRALPILRPIRSFGSRFRLRGLASVLRERDASRSFCLRIFRGP